MSNNMLSQLVSSFRDSDLRDLVSRDLSNSQLNEVVLDLDPQAVLEICIDLVDTDFDHHVVFDPFIRIHICNEDGSYVTTLRKDNGITMLSTIADSEERIFYAPRGHTLSMRKQSYNKEKREDFSLVWEEKIVINESYRHILKDSTVFLFEIVDTKGAEGIQDPWSEEDYNQIAWGFLKPFSRNSKCNVGEKLDDMKRCRLQLFKFQVNKMSVRRRAKQMKLWNNTNVPQVFLQYLRVNYIPVKSSLYVKIGPILLIDEKNDEDKEMIAFPLETATQIKKESLMNTNPNHKDKLFKRYHGQRCLIPDSLLHKVDVESPETLKFSPSGDYLAVATNASSVYIYNVENGKKSSTLMFHTDKITALVWCHDDKYLSSASMDGTIVIFELKGKWDEDNEMKLNTSPTILFSLMPNHSPISLEFVAIKHLEEDESSFSSFILSASNKTLKLWSINEERCVGDLNGGKAHHTAPITAVTKDDSNYRIYSADAKGFIIIWILSSKINLNTISGSDYEILHRIDGFRNLNGSSIRALDFSTVGGQKRLLVTTDDRSDRNLYMYDFACQSMVPFCSEIKMSRTSFSTAMFSPDGTLAVSGTRDGEIVYFDASSGVSLEVRCETTMQS